MSLSPEAAAVVTKVVPDMPTPPMQEVGIFAAGKSNCAYPAFVQRARTSHYLFTCETGSSLLCVTGTGKDRARRR